MPNATYQFPFTFNTFILLFLFIIHRTGVRGVDPADNAKAMFKAMRKCFPKNLKTVRVIIFQKDMVTIFLSTLKSTSQGPFNQVKDYVSGMIKGIQICLVYFALNQKFFYEFWHLDCLLIQHKDIILKHKSASAKPVFKLSSIRISIRIPSISISSKHFLISIQ